MPAKLCGVGGGSDKEFVIGQLMLERVQGSSGVVIGSDDEDFLRLLISDASGDIMRLGLGGEPEHGANVNVLMLR